ncbi:chemotaxis protein CheW [Halorientalis pallida]|uniref:Purine-binding chemotaxis protein CheW n=1 Tax=Halorientalis pallida TaxID=2479928 RepID=A0A498KT21_9EURY|nr:chemotaxis protein CheW [Halorientalis pallida]RXK47245.1 purine-binding chemotaxis protein CheW [Halorientalis pallida]
MSQATPTDTAEATGQVLEFKLGPETYCVDIDYVTEIVDVGELTGLPNAPDYVKGVMDLRGRTTAIVDPKTIFDIDGADADAQRIIVFDPEIIADRKAAGWLVDEVHQVVKLDPDTIEEAPDSGREAVRGVINHEDEDEAGFVIWVDPQAVHK